MKNNITGKQINEWVQMQSNEHGSNWLPQYWNDVYDWNDTKHQYTKRVKGEFLAKKYKAIVNLIEETNAKVNITEDTIFIEYQFGKSRIQRDIFTDTFLLPLLTNKN